MASLTESTIKNLQKIFEPYVKPREQINYIRRVLALELGSYTGDGPTQQPLSLNNDPVHKEIGPELKGLHREYLEALRANLSARQNFEETVHGQDRSSSLDPKCGKNTSLLEDHLAVSRLRKKRDSLNTVHLHLERLAEMPIASQAARDIEQILKDGNPQPKVPADVLNSFVVEQTSAEVDLQSRISQLEKTVLRAKLVLKREESLLADAKARCKLKPELVSNGAKMEALNCTRNELINWIETELSKASSEEKKNGGGSQGKQIQAAEIDQSGITGQVQHIQVAYKAYVAARRDMLALISCSPQPLMAPPEKVNRAMRSAETNESPSMDYLLIPHIEALLSQSRRQKGLIFHKSHFATTLNNQRRESCQAIGRLAEESQLLPAYPIVDSTRRRSGVPETMAAKHSDRGDLARGINPWIFAVDAAKIGTLEAVAEKVEVGQIALENSMEALREMESLLGVRDEPEEGAGATLDTTEGDLWLDDGVAKGAGVKASHKNPLKAKPIASQNKADPWARLHGNLGLIGHDDVP